MDATFTTSKRKKIMQIKGALVAEFLTEFKLTPEQVQQLIDTSKLDKELVDKILAGDVTPVPVPFIDALKVVLKLTPEQVTKLEALAKQELEPKEPTPEPTLPPAEELANKPCGDDDEMKKAKADYAKCVSDKISLLLKEGKPHDQAVAIALNYCDSEKCKALNEQPSVPATAKADATDFGSPFLDIAKAQLAMLGAVLQELKTLNEVLLKNQNASVAKPENMGENNSNTDANDDTEQLAKILVIKNRLKAALNN
jgi:hypothetical protein